MKKDKVRKAQKQKLKRKLEKGLPSVERKIETIQMGKEYYENVEEHQSDE